jgi:hypothetical protein
MSLNSITIFDEFSNDIDGFHSEFIIRFYDKGDWLIINISHTIFHYSYDDTEFYTFEISKFDLENNWYDLYLRWQLSLLFTFDIPSADIYNDYLTLPHFSLSHDLSIDNDISYSYIPLDTSLSKNVHDDLHSWIDVKYSSTLPPFPPSLFLTVFNNFFINTYFAFNYHIDKIESYFSTLSSRKSTFLSLDILNPDLLSYIFKLSIS